MFETREVVVSIRIDEHIARELERIENRSAFIRESIEIAVQRLCPLCRGRGNLGGMIESMGSTIEPPLGGTPLPSNQMMPDPMADLHGQPQTQGAL